jgi:cytochrome c peroxidase
MVRVERFRSALAVLAALLAVTVPGTPSHAEYGGNGGLLPAGTELGDEALYRPAERFRSESIGGRKSYLVNLGEVLFSSPAALGGLARKAGISCATCHVNGAANARLYIPGLSSQPGTFDTTGPLFNPKADNGVLDPVRVPSLRGARQLAPYGADGRTASLRDFVRNVVVGEFSGPEPSPETLDALAAYIADIDFLPNRRLGAGGRLTGRTSDSERRGEALFFRPFTLDPSLSCAGCHVPSAAFVDHRQHDVGSEGHFKTPTLLNANFNAPYFHDGRYTTYAEVVTHFDRVFYLGLTAQERRDLVAYLTAIGDGEEPWVRDGVDSRLQEIEVFSSVLDTAIPARDVAVVALTVDTMGGELRELTERFPGRKNSAVVDGEVQRTKARAALMNAVLSLREVEAAARQDRFDEAASAWLDHRSRLAAALPLLKAAEPWSLFDRDIRNAHLAALRQLYRTAIDPTRVVPARYDPD